MHGINMEKKPSLALLLKFLAGSGRMMHVVLNSLQHYIKENRFILKNMMLLIIKKDLI